MNELQTFEARIKEKLKESIADLIPAEKLDAIVRSTTAEFMTKDLPTLIKAELTSQYQEVITAEFAKPEWQATWANGRQEAGPALKQLLIESAPLVLASMIASISQTVLFNFQQQTQNIRPY